MLVFLLVGHANRNYKRHMHFVPDNRTTNGPVQKGDLGPVRAHRRGCGDHDKDTEAPDAMIPQETGRAVGET